MSADLVFKGLIGCTKNAFDNKNNKRFSLFGNPVYKKCYNNFGAFLTLRVCLHGGRVPQMGGNPLRWGEPPVHIISHFYVITFTC